MLISVIIIIILINIWEGRMKEIVQTVLRAFLLYIISYKVYKFFAWLIYSIYSLLRFIITRSFKLIIITGPHLPRLFIIFSIISILYVLYNSPNTPDDINLQLREQELAQQQQAIKEFLASHPVEEILPLPNR